MSIQPTNMSLPAISATPTPRELVAPSGTARTETNSTAGVSKTQASAQQLPPPALEDVQKAMEEVRKVVAPVAESLQFSIDADSGRTVVKIMDASTDEVIRQIPSEEVLAMAKALDKLQGLLIKQKA